MLATCALPLYAILTVELVYAENCEDKVWPIGDPRRCQNLLYTQDSLPTYTIGILPGNGWDNLRNEEAGQIIEHTYQDCTLTIDGQKLIPDNFLSTPIKNYVISAKSEIVEQWLSTKSATAFSINANGEGQIPFVSLSGAFSFEKSTIQEKQSKLSSIMIRTQLRLERYRVALQPDSKLAPEFRNRIKLIAHCVEQNLTKLAVYEAQMLLKDYGTHLITSVIAGATLIKDDYISRSSLNSTKTDEFSVSLGLKAEFSFPEIPGLKGSRSLGYSQSQTEKFKESYESIIQYSSMTAHGGGLVDLKSRNYNGWYEGVEENLVPIDRNGEPIYYLFTSTAFPELSVQTLSGVVNHVKDAFADYYEINAIKGCTIVSLGNYNPRANALNMEACFKPQSQYILGGVFQTCSVIGGDTDEVNPCNNMEHPNPKTGDLKCPSTFESGLMYSGVHDVTVEKSDWCDLARGVFIIGMICPDNTFTASAKIETYWCYALPRNTHSSYYNFGGLYTKKSENIFNNKFQCLSGYKPYTILMDLVICLSESTESSGITERIHVELGGFFSCREANPVVGKTERRCPLGFTQHVAAEHKECLIFYCLGSTSISVITNIKKLPFLDKPEDARNSEFALVVEEIPEGWILLITEKETMGLCIATGLACIVLYAVIIKVAKVLKRKHHKKDLVGNPQLQATTVSHQPPDETFVGETSL